MPDDAVKVIAESFITLERIKMGDWPDWMLTTEYPCDACEKRIAGLTYKQMWEKDWELRRGTSLTMVLFYCDACKKKTA